MVPVAMDEGPLCTREGLGGIAVSVQSNKLEAIMRSVSVTSVSLNIPRVVVQSKEMVDALGLLAGEQDIVSLYDSQAPDRGARVQEGSQQAEPDGSDLRLVKRHHQHDWDQHQHVHGLDGRERGTLVATVQEIDKVSRR